MKKIIITSLLVLFSFGVFCQNTSGTVQEKIDKQTLKSYIKILSSDSLEGRMTGAAGQKKAASFIADKFKTLELDSFNEKGYFQKFKLKQSSWGEVYIKTDKFILNNFETIVCMSNLSQNEEVKKELVFGGYGSEDQLKKINVKGRAVLIFVKNLRSTYQIRKRLEKEKAYAVIFANPDKPEQFESIKKTFKKFKLRTKTYLPDEKLPFKIEPSQLYEFLIPNSQLKNLTGLTSKQLKKYILTGNIKTCPKSEIKFKCEKIIEEIDTENVIGTIQGTGNKSIIISAHYDHLGKTETTFYPGADDNASGTSALIEIAEAFSEKEDLYYSLIFLATTGEEEGLLGSKYYVGTDNYNPEDIVINLNMDMISRNDHKKKADNNYLYSIGTDLHPQFSYILQKADSINTDCAFNYSLNNSASLTNSYRNSDQYSFYKSGVPAIIFFSGLHDDYHKPSDTYEKINYSLLESRVRLISIVIELLQEYR